MASGNEQLVARLFEGFCDFNQVPLHVVVLDVYDGGSAKG